MGKRITLSESEKLNIQNLYKGLLSEQQEKGSGGETGGNIMKPNPEGPSDNVKGPNPRKYLPISDEFCDIRLGKAQVKKGAEGELVKLFQEALIKCGIELPEFGADGKFGNETRDGVREFQRREDLTVDGGIGIETSGKLCELGCIPKEICSKCENSDEIDNDVPDQVGGVECDKVKECYKKALYIDVKDPSESLKRFAKCMGLDKCFDSIDGIGNPERTGKCKGCPEVFNAQPGPNRKLDSKTYNHIQYCADEGCTQIVV